MYLLRRSFHSILLTGLLLLGAATAANDSNAYAVSLLAAMQVFGITTSDVCTATGITCTGGFVTGIKLDAYPSMTTNFRKIPDHTTDPFYTYSYEEMTITSIKCARCVYVEGSLPAAWSRIKTLTSIIFNDCRLTGTLPVAWSAFTALKELRLDSNKVTGTLPLGWSSITSLQSLRVGGNQITGTLPPEWKSMSNLEELDLHSNQLTGTLPPEWKSMNNLQRLDLFRNQLTGTLPAQWSIMPRLRTLFLDSNQLSGCIPESYTSQKNTFAERHCIGEQSTVDRLRAAQLERSPRQPLFFLHFLNQTQRVSRVGKLHSLFG
ncbi:Leucine Rich repeats (2 copies)/Leucine rich repeat/Leucine Rich Repeat, putative [Angomonas deanei]|uniref:Leucine Rich repeats (2 copies)/Leucine rich repeat/Leucine Rich Repeat, putative n=1 Tax=Angomonas deanei TaxID=59799 RepID=A0A7G2CKT8_9TRYP|nr:Leucine Rich repeats (2 copies)/Leucine rich repeat/Leucine Rich Repeat, putative [Angomonas deanei]